MKLNKIFAIALCALCFTACSDDDDKPEIPETPDTPENPDTPNNPDDPDKPDNQLVFVLNQGNMGKNIPGSLSKIDLTAGTIVNNAFKDANGRILGDTPQSVIIYGDKMYIAVYQSNIIEIVDKNTLVSEKTIKLGNTACSPRYMAAKDNYVYISMYDGYVSRLDTKTQTIDKTIAVGPNPNEVALAGDYLYVANSDGENAPNYGTTVSKINLSTFTEEKKIEVGLNPYKMASNGEDAFVICMGNYQEVSATIKKINSDDTVTEICPATMAVANGDDLYIVNDPNYGTGTEYYRYKISTKEKAALTFDKIIAPQAIGINPKDGHIFISTLSVVYGWSDPCFVNEYTANCEFVNQYKSGIYSASIVF